MFPWPRWNGVYVRMCVCASLGEWCVYVSVHLWGNGVYVCVFMCLWGNSMCVCVFVCLWGNGVYV